MPIAAPEVTDQYEVTMLEDLDFELKCEIEHDPSKRFGYSCSGPAVAVRFVSCKGVRILICENTLKFGPLSPGRQAQIQYHCKTCGRKLPDCWTETRI